jgi:MFS family permease
MHPVDRPLPRQPGLPTAGLAALLTTAIAGADMAALATTMPPLVNQLVSGIDNYAWPFFLYMAAFVASMPLWGLIVSRLGRKWVALIGALVYILGSVLATDAWQFVIIVGCRILQGIGLGAMMPSIYSLAMASDQRSVQAVPWVAVLAGLGGGPIAWWLVHDGYWPALFWAQAMAGGLIALTVLAGPGGSRDMQVVAHQVADQLDLAETPVFNLFAMPATLMLSGLLAFNPRLGDDEANPVALPEGGHFRMAATISTLMGSATVTMMVFLPVHLQGSAGLPLWTTAAAMTLVGLGTPLGSGLGDRLHRRIGAAGLARGGLLLSAGTAVALASGLPTGPDGLGWLIWLLLFGLGMGLAHRGLLAYTRERLSADRRGPGMGLLMMFRAIGGPFGTGLVGAELAAILGTTLLPLEKTNRLLGAQHGSDLVPRLHDGLLPLLQTATTSCQWTIAGLTIVTALLALAWRPTADGPAPQPDEGEA